ncbi:hypothetical protein [Clostridium gasigenes]|uniref:hypothetical protein n=1 Tax=Clostridium gasigenes TaxID=94869 RepID=UPI001C0E41D9|nr:hypothetical protein [Clostridium gasigenes]MBU3106278.1 hypothetical protein [Clostridium gasigenes]
MTNFKKAIALGTILFTIGTTSVTAFAASNYKTPAEAVAGITGKTVESVTAEKSETGKNYGAIAKEAGKLEEFKAEKLEMKKDKLNAQVAAGTITQDKADEIIAAIIEKQATCDGTGTSKIGKGMGAGFGSNGKAGNGEHKGNGGAGHGQGTGL